VAIWAETAPSHDNFTVQPYNYPVMTNHPSAQLTTRASKQGQPRPQELRPSVKKSNLEPKNPIQSKPVQPSPTCIFHPTAVALINSESPWDGCERVRTSTNASMTMNAIHHVNLCRDPANVRSHFAQKKWNRKSVQISAIRCKFWTITANHRAERFNDSTPPRRLTASRSQRKLSIHV
jgi:hypothetical protein